MQNLTFLSIFSSLTSALGAPVNITIKKNIFGLLLLIKEQIWEYCSIDLKQPNEKNKQANEKEKQKKIGLNNA